MHMQVIFILTIADYCASKFAMVGFHESLRQELKSTYYY